MLRGGDGLWELMCREDVVGGCRAGGCRTGGCRVGGYCFDAIVSGTMVSGAVVWMSTVSKLSCWELWGWGLL